MVQRFTDRVEELIRQLQGMKPLTPTQREDVVYALGRLLEDNRQLRRALVPAPVDETAE